MNKHLKRIGVVAVLLVLVLLQISWTNGTWPWLQPVFLILVLYTAYNRTAWALVPAAIAGVFLEAFAITQTGMTFLTYVGTILVMLILVKTILSHVSVFSLATLVFAGTLTFGILSYLQTIFTSAVFLHHSTNIHQPFALLGLFFLSVFTFFILHATTKAGLSRWAPSIHKALYGETV